MELASNIDANTQGQARRGAWREVEVVLLALLCFATYFVPLTRLPIRGEESRWATVAREMLETGDYIVPRQQGEPFADRPPLNSWCMILASKLLGRFDLAAIRLPSALATLLTVVLIYIYGRRFLSRSAALAAGAAYATMIHVLQLGRLAESDALLTLCVTGSLFGWHTAYDLGRRPLFTWVCGYSIAALAALAKGPQGPVYFVAATTVWLLVRRDFRFLFSWGHLAGIVTFVAVLGSWQVPFLCTLGWYETRSVWSEGSSLGARFDYSQPLVVARQLLGYPLAVAAAMLPWSLFLPVLAPRRNRQWTGPVGSHVGFLLTACAIAFPTCWLPAESRPRYFMSLYPCLALVMGLGIEFAWRGESRTWFDGSWRRYAIGMAGVMLAMAILAPVVASGGFAGLELSPAQAVLLVALSLAGAVVVWRSRGGETATRRQAGVLATALFVGITYSMLGLGGQLRMANPAAEQIAQLKAKLGPAAARLVSLGPAHHQFAYYYQQPIALVRRPEPDRPFHADFDYFCFLRTEGEQVYLPFAWEEVMIVSCDRNKLPQPRDMMVVGRRLAGPVAATHSGESKR